MSKSVNMIIRLNSIEPTDESETAVEMALDRLPAGVIASLDAAGFKVALPLDYEVLSVDLDAPTLFDSDERFDLDGEDRAYAATHRSKYDSSDAMLVGVEANGKWATFANECGEEWRDWLADWEQIA